MTTSSSSFFASSMRSDKPLTKCVHGHQKLGTVTTENLTHILQKCPQFTNHPAYCCVCENISNATFVELLNKTSSFTVRMSQMLRLPGKIYGCKFEDIMGNWRKLHKEEHHNMCTR